MIDAFESYHGLVKELKALHSPFKIYTECDHEHAEDEPGVVEIEEIGFVCQEGLRYVICNECCMHHGYQAEDCADCHEHSPDEPICATVELIEKSLGLSADSSEGDKR